eukprot:CCRYP_010416-RA/>CCRYP_010416-RA protein AED:0.56 eAED:0.34 QI:0/-1/0/1/-1/1/1/0/777
MATTSMAVSQDYWLDLYWEDGVKIARQVHTNRASPLYVTRGLLENARESLTFVSPKTSGERGYLVCKRNSDVCTLHLDNGVVIHMPVHKTVANSDGFILDVEVIKRPLTMIPLFIIAFAVLKVDPRNVIFSDEKFQKYTNHIPDLTVDRFNLLRSIVSNVHIQGLISKPIFQAIVAVKLWGSIQIFPYPVDGLIFLEQYSGRYRIWKWKPANEVTVTVALHEQKESHCFLPFIGPETLIDQYPFYRFASPGVFEYSGGSECVFEDESATKVTTSRIQYSCNGNSIGKEEISYTYREFASRESLDGSQLVEVPSELRSFLGYQIAEVKLDIGSGALNFRRLRYDKKRPNNKCEIEHSILNAMHSIELSHIIDEMNINYDTARVAYQEKSPSRSLLEFHQCMHKINVFVYDTFGGKSVIDAGCGSLDVWKEAHVDHVWAILHPSRSEAGRRKGKVIDHAPIEVLEINLKESQKCLSPLREKVDSVFCNSALHHFWDSEETTQVFLQNLVPLLKPCGLFVVTFLCLDLIPQDESTLQFYTDEALLEFQVSLQRENKIANIYENSTGASFVECLLNMDEVKKRFSDANLSFAANYTFKQLGIVAPSIYRELDSFSGNMRKLSSFYCCALFQKVITAIDIQEDVLISGMVKGLDQDVLSYLPMADLVSARRVSKFWKLSIDSIDRSFSEENTTWVNENCPYHSMRSFLDELSLPSIGCFLRFGGNLEPMDYEYSDDNFESPDYDYEDTFGEVGIYHYHDDFDYERDYDDSGDSVDSGYTNRS